MKRLAFHIGSVQEADKKAVKAKSDEELMDELLAANPGAAVAQLDRPKSKKLVKESMAASFSAMDAATRTVRVRIILEGPGNDFDKHWYSERAIQDGVLKFAGARAFLNHQTAEEAEARPEQDVQFLAGFYKNLSVGRAFNVKLGKMVPSLDADFVANESEAGDTALALARAQVLWQQTYPMMQSECHAAISINSGGWSDGTVDYQGEEWTNVVAFEDVRSADIVTRPGAGGAFVSLQESLAGASSKTVENEPMKKKMRMLAVALEVATHKVKQEKDEAKKAILETARQQALKDFNEAMTAVVEAEKEKKEGEGGDGEGEEDEAETSASAMDALKQHVPQHDGENDQQYGDRLAAIQKHAAGAGVAAADGEGEEEEGEDGAGDSDGDMEPAAKKPPMPKESGRHRETAAVTRFRTEQPMLYREVMNTLRESVGAERTDFKSLKARITTLEGENRTLRLDRDLGLCEDMLNEADIPRDILAAGDLVKMDVKAREREVKRWSMAMEAAGARRVFNGEGRQGGGSEDFSDLNMAGIGSAKA